MVTFAGWGAVARSLHGWTDVTFWPVITKEAHLALAGAKVHSKNTAEMSAIVEALSFLGPHGPVARDAHSCFSLIPSMLLGHNSCSHARSYKRPKGFLGDTKGFFGIPATGY